jgi:hypothetical protein
MLPGVIPEGFILDAVAKGLDTSNQHQSEKRLLRKITA